MTDVLSCPLLRYLYIYSSHIPLIHIYTLRSLYKLPVLLLDDFADVTPAVVRQAYIEALYRVEEWEYTRITERHWVTILKEVTYISCASIYITYILLLDYFFGVYTGLSYRHYRPHAQSAPYVGRGPLLHPPTGALRLRGHGGLRARDQACASKVCIVICVY